MWRTFKKCKEYFSTINNLLCDGKIIWRLKSFNWMPSTSSNSPPVPSTLRNKKSIRDIFHSKSVQEHKPLSDALVIPQITPYCCFQEAAPTIPKRKGVDLESEPRLQAISSGGRGLDGWGRLVSSGAVLGKRVSGRLKLKHTTETRTFQWSLLLPLPTRAENRASDLSRKVVCFGQYKHPSWFQ